MFFGLVVAFICLNASPTLNLFDGDIFIAAQNRQLALKFLGRVDCQTGSYQEGSAVKNAS
jgi:hypothetical protein